jgi:hypothetical protein
MTPSTNHGAACEAMDAKQQPMHTARAVARLPWWRHGPMVFKIIMWARRGKATMTQTMMTAVANDVGATNGRTR